MKVPRRRQALVFDRWQTRSFSFSFAGEGFKKLYVGIFEKFQSSLWEPGKYPHIQGWAGRGEGVEKGMGPRGELGEVGEAGEVGELGEAAEVGEGENMGEEKKENKKRGMAIPTSTFPFVDKLDESAPISGYGLFSVDAPSKGASGGKEGGKEGEEGEGLQKALLPPSGDLLECPPEVGDLVVVKCDLQFASIGNYYPKIFMLPEGLADRFVSVDVADHTKIKPATSSNYFPILNLNVFLDPESMLDLAESDYEDNMGDTKIWDRADLGGIRQRDYIRKRAWLQEHYSNSITFSSGKFNTDYVELHTLVWREDDLITGIPGVMETRREKHWFLDNWNSNIYKSFKDIKKGSYVKFPLVGIVGTLLDTKTLTHSMTKDGNYINGTDFETTFYKVLFKNRIPVWVDAPVWKCPQTLCLPIYLPIP